MFNFKVSSRPNGGTDCVLISDGAKYTVRFSVRFDWVKSIALGVDD